MHGMISVIMAEHNTEKALLKKSINSILKQTYKNFELIIVDDMTNEENRKYLRKLESQNSKVRIIYNDTNLGLAASLNKAIDHSKGQYIFRMDTDDIAHPKRFERQLDILRNKKQFITTARATIIDDNGKANGVIRRYPFHNIVKRIQLYYFFANGVVHPLVAAKRQVFDEFRYDEELTYAQDFELWLRMGKKYKIFFDKQILLGYRVKNKINKEKVFIQYKTHRKTAKKYMGRDILKKMCFYITDKKNKEILSEKLNIDRGTLEDELNIK